MKKAGCRVVYLKSWQGVSSYVSKYCGKEVAELAAETGRIWGIVNRKQMPVTLRTEVIPAPVGKKVRRVLRKLQERRREVWYVEHAPGEWHRVRPSWQKLPGERGSVRISVEQQLATARVCHLRIKRKRQRILASLVVPIWAEVVEERTGLKARRWLEKQGEEVQAVCSSRHFIRPETVTNLVAWAKSVRAWQQEQEKCLPF